MTLELALQLGLVFTAATVVATVAGFGNSLAAMPLLIGLVGVRAAAPMMAMAGFVTWAVLFTRLRRQIAVAVVWRVIAASLVTIPLGVAFVSRGPELWLRVALGIVTIAYVVYRWSGRKPPEVAGPAWAFGVGAAGGVLSGAFNSAGPVVVAYADARRWDPDQFRGNLSGFFMANLVMVNIAHFASGNVTTVVWQGFLVSVPFVLVGLVAGTLLVRRVDRVQFGRLVLALLFVLGLRLALSGVF